MDKKDYTIREFNIKEASNQEYEELVALENIYFKETNPDDPPIKAEYLKKRLTSAPENIIKIKVWQVRDKETNALIGRCLAFFPLMDNTQMGEFEPYVHPDWRQNGVAKALLKHFIVEAKAENRTKVFVFVHNQIQAGVTFAERMGASKGLGFENNQAVVAEVDRDLMRQWIKNAEKKAAGFELGFWEGLPTDIPLEDVAELINVMNTSPMEDLDYEDVDFTPERLQEIHKSDQEVGNVHLWGFTREIESGELAGFTEVVWNPDQGYLLRQYRTGVLPKYRGKGLGRWLKAAMFEKVVEELPEVKFIRTNNAGTNAPMLKINHEMGFKLYRTDAIWQVDVEKVEDYLSQ